MVDLRRTAMDFRLATVYLNGVRIGGLLGPSARLARVLERPRLPLPGALGPSQGCSSQIFIGHGSRIPLSA